MPTTLHQAASLPMFSQAQGVPATRFIITHLDNMDGCEVKGGNCKTDTHCHPDASRKQEQGKNQHG